MGWEGGKTETGGRGRKRGERQMKRQKDWERHRTREWSRGERKDNGGEEAERNTALQPKWAAPLRHSALVYDSPCAYVRGCECMCECARVCEALESVCDCSEKSKSEGFKKRMSRERERLRNLYLLNIWSSLSPLIWASCQVLKQLQAQGRGEEELQEGERREWRREKQEDHSEGLLARVLADFLHRNPTEMKIHVLYIPNLHLQYCFKLEYLHTSGVNMEDIRHFTLTISMLFKDITT